MNATQAADPIASLIHQPQPNSRIQQVYVFALALLRDPRAAPLWRHETGMLYLVPHVHYEFDPDARAAALETLRRLGDTNPIASRPATEASH